MPRKLSRTGPVRFACYARCSSDDQAHKDFSTIDTQKAYNAEYVQAQGGTVVGEYADEGKSGTTTSRTHLDRMLADAQANKFDVVICTYMSRLGRGNAYIIIEHELNKCGVTVQMVREQFADDLAGYMGKAMTNMMDGLYPKMVSGWTKAKQEKMFERGYLCGHVPFGYDKEIVTDAGGFHSAGKEPPKRAVPHPEHAETVRQAFALYLSTGTVARVRDFLRAATGRMWTTTQATALLTDERYTGVALFGQWRKEDAHPTIVDKDTWRAAQETHGRRPTLYPAQQDDFAYYLRGRVFCPHCGCPYTYAGATGQARKVHYYVCRSVHRNGKASACPVRRVPAARLHLSVLHHLHHVTTHKTALHGLIAKSGGWGTADDTLRAVRGQYGKQKQVTEARITRYIQRIGDGVDSPAILAALQKDEALCASLVQQIAEADVQIAAATIHRPTAERVAEGWGRLFDVWSILTEDEREEMLGAVVERVDIDDKKSAAVDFNPWWGPISTTALSLVQPNGTSGSGGWT